MVKSAGLPMTALPGASLMSASCCLVGSNENVQTAVLLLVKPFCEPLTFHEKVVLTPAAMPSIQVLVTVNGLAPLPEATLVIEPLVPVPVPVFQIWKFSVSVPPSGSDTVAYSLMSPSPM